MRFTFFRRNAAKPYHERLRALTLFQDLNAKELDIKHEVLFDEGEEGHAIYIIVSGHVLICRNGGKTLIADLGPGNFFGELALLTNAPRATQARAGSNCRALVFFRDDFNNLMHTHVVIASKIGINLARHVGMRLRESVVGRHVEQSL